MKIWIVRGGTGFGNDRQEWPVAAFMIHERAEKRAGDARRRAKEIYDGRSEGMFPWGVPGEIPKNEHDPEMAIDYGGTDYWVDATELIEGDE